MRFFDKTPTATPFDKTPTTTPFLRLPPFLRFSISPYLVSFEPTTDYLYSPTLPAGFPPTWPPSSPQRTLWFPSTTDLYSSYLASLESTTALYSSAFLFFWVLGRPFSRPGRLTVESGVVGRKLRIRPRQSSGRSTSFGRRMMRYEFFGLSFFAKPSVGTRSGKPGKEGDSNHPINRWTLNLGLYVGTTAEQNFE